MKINDHGAWPQNETELLRVMREQLKGEHGYNTAVDATIECTLAMFNYCAHYLGLSGFQASFADLAFVGRTRSLKGPYALLNGENLLYPQYDLREDFEKYMREWPAQLKDLAQEKLDKDDGFMHPRVRARMQEIANS